MSRRFKCAGFGEGGSSKPRHVLSYAGEAVITRVGSHGSGARSDAESVPGASSTEPARGARPERTALAQAS